MYPGWGNLPGTQIVVHDLYVYQQIVYVDNQAAICNLIDVKLFYIKYCFGFYKHNTFKHVFHYANIVLKSL